MEKENSEEIESKITVSFPPSVGVEFSLNKIKRRFDKIKLSLFKSKDSYKYLSCTKSVTIYKNRHGIVQHSVILKVLNNDFKEISYNFGVGKSADKELAFQPFEDFKKNFKENPKNRFQNQTFIGKLFSINGKPVVKNRQELLTEPDEGIYDSPKKKNFKIKFSESIILKPGDVIKFVFAWSSYNLFPTEKEDVERMCIDKKALPESSVNIIYPIDRFRYIISFEEGINLCRPPTIYNKNEEPMSELEEVSDVYYNRYISKDIKARVGDKYIVKWTYID